MEHDGDDVGGELARLVRAAREHLEWLERGGVTATPRRKAALRGTGRVPSVASAPPAATLTTSSMPPAATEEPTPIAAAPSPSPSDGARTPRGDHFGAAGLAQIRADLGDCTRCKLAPTRKNIVFGVGSAEAPLVFVGEGPGADEDRTGEPFVGAAGQLLDRMIAAMGFTRDEIYICNVVKCRPPGNRTPESDEVAQCQPFLERQLLALRPRMIVTLGKPAAHALTGSTAPISAMRGRLQTWQGIPLMPTFHPAYLLRTPSAKREVWEDLKVVMGELDRLGIPRRKT